MIFDGGYAQLQEGWSGKNNFQYDGTPTPPSGQNNHQYGGIATPLPSNHRHMKFDGSYAEQQEGWSGQNNRPQTTILRSSMEVAMFSHKRGGVAKMTTGMFRRQLP
ncbi:hypothetical protein CsSME_00021754 [Camellia sinensis var. sinensis]